MSSRWLNLKQIDRGQIEYLTRNLDNFETDEDIKKGLIAAGGIFRTGGQKRLRERMKSGSRGVTGNLLRSIKVRAAKKKPMVFSGFVAGGQHSHLVDIGTVKRYRNKMRGWIKNSNSGNTTTGTMVGNHFWDDTASQDYPQAVGKIYEGIERAVNRINNRQ